MNSPTNNKWETDCGKHLLWLIKLVAKVENKSIERVSMEDLVRIIMESGQKPLLVLARDSYEMNGTLETIQSLEDEKKSLEVQLNNKPDEYSNIIVDLKTDFSKYFGFAA